MNLPQYGKRLPVVEPEVRRACHQHLHVGDGAVLLGQPGLGLAVLVRERVEVKGGRKAPHAVLDMQEAVVLQVVVHVGDQQVEHQAPPELA